MTPNALLQTGLYLGVLLACVRPLGLYMAKVYSGTTPFPGRLAGPVGAIALSPRRRSFANEK